MTVAEGPHPFPSRTRSLSPPAPTILRGQPRGTIGRRRSSCAYRISYPSPGSPDYAAFSAVSSRIALLLVFSSYLYAQEGW